MPQFQAKNLSLIAAIDLGSNSFHMVVAKAQNGEIRILERLGEKVQLAAGIDDERQLNEESMQRGLDCLKRFAQLINGMPLGAVRIVGTNALREARNRGEFIRRAEEILGHPVEVISGREEARLIYLGVSHTLADTPGKRLVADIGGGSTEFIIGQRFEPLLRESLQMGCVSYTQRYFKDGKITPARYAQAYTAARLEIMSIEHALHRLTWDEAIGSSGTIRAIGLALKAGGHGTGEVNAEGLAWPGSSASCSSWAMQRKSTSTASSPTVAPSSRPAWRFSRRSSMPSNCNAWTTVTAPCEKACSTTCWAVITTRTYVSAPSAR